MTRYLLGVDGGASKTRCLVATMDGSIAASGHGDCANKNITSWEAATLQVRLAVIEALAKSGILPSEIASAHYGLGGVATLRCEQEWRSALQDLSPQAAITVENDVFLPIYATEQRFGIGVVSGSGGNIGAISKNGKFHVNGYVRFNSSQLGRRALQWIMPQILEGNDLDAFTQALLELAGLDEKTLREGMHTRPQGLAQDVSPFLIELCHKGHQQAHEIVHSWLEIVSTDIQNFQQANDLETLPICFGGATFCSMHSVLKTHLQVQGEILVAPVAAAEGALIAAKNQIM